MADTGKSEGDPKEPEKQRDDDEQEDDMHVKLENPKEKPKTPQPDVVPAETGEKKRLRMLQCSCRLSPLDCLGIQFKKRKI